MGSAPGHPPIGCAKPGKDYCMFDISKTKAVLWDLDDTLYSRVAAARQTYPGMFRQHLYPDSDDAFLEAAAEYMITLIRPNSMIHRDSFAALLEKYPPDKEFVYEDCLEYYYNYMYTFAKPFPEQLEVVKKLRSLGVKTAIVTNIQLERLTSQRNKITKMGLAPYFDAIVYSGEFGVHKPDRRVFDHAASLLGVSNDACVFVGDDPTSDITGARNAGMEAVWLDRWGHGDLFRDDPHVHRVASVSEYFSF